MKRLLPFVFMLFGCDKSTTPPNTVPPAGDLFANTPLNYGLTRPIPEASGIADSKTIDDHLWVIEDSGNPARLFLLKHEGFVTDSINITGATNRDWEDVAIAKGPEDGQSYLYIADIGDNNLAYSSYTIYRMPEPKVLHTDVTVFDKIEFTYPDGPHDAEAFMVDDKTKDIFIITKRDATAKVYRIPYPQDAQNMNQAQFVGDLPFLGIVSATLSNSGREVILKTYTALYYYNRTAMEGLDVTLAKSPSDTLAYQLESQGEAVAIANDNSGFFTLSEKGMSDVAPDLLFYRRTR
jgi:hypothetical protein